MFKKIRSYPLLLIIGLFVIVFSVLDLTTPNRVYSENENKYLATFPKLTFRSLVDGSFTSKYETYTSDQFLLRDFWISAKSVSEVLLLKTENNGVVYGEKGYMFSKFYSYDPTYLKDNLSALYIFCREAGTTPMVMIVPSAYTPLEEYMLRGMPAVDESFYIDEIYDFLRPVAKTVDVKKALSVHSDSYIYYRTDHHWTTYGAYIGYSQIGAVAGFGVPEYKSYNITTVPDFLGSNYNKCKYIFAKTDTMEFIDFGFPVTVTIDGVAHDSMYNTEQLDKRDKYSAYIWGNNAYTVITSEPSKNKRDSILVVKDSYANELVPFLTEQYNTVYVIDPRYYGDSFAQLLYENSYTDILLLFSFENLATDSSIAKLGF